MLNIACSGCPFLTLYFPRVVRASTPPTSSPPHAESEVCKLETLLQSEVSVVTTDEAAGADLAKALPGLRRRKRTCSRRTGEKEREREGGAMGPGDRGVGEQKDRREASK